VSSTPPSPHEGTPAPDAPTVEGPAVPASAPAAAEAPAGPTASGPETSATAPVQPPVTRRRRFLSWVRTPVGVGVLVAAAMLVFVVLPCAVGSFALGYAGGHGERGDRGGYGREFGDRHDDGSHDGPRGRWTGGEGPAGN
jgi:hypothetical protein